MNKVRIIKKDDCISPINDNQTFISVNKMPTIYESDQSLNNCTKIRCNSLDIDKIKGGRIRSCSIDEIISGRMRSCSTDENTNGHVEEKLRGCSHIRRITELINRNNRNSESKN
jgi:hypothetical protein